jgi:hypothetical protein
MERSHVPLSTWFWSVPQDAEALPDMPAFLRRSVGYQVMDRAAAPPLPIFGPDLDCPAAIIDEMDAEE